MHIFKLTHTKIKEGAMHKVVVPKVIFDVEHVGVDHSFKTFGQKNDFSVSTVDGIVVASPTNAYPKTCDKKSCITIALLGNQDDTTITMHYS